MRWRLLLLNLVLCLSLHIVVICVLSLFIALPFVLPDMHRVAAPIHSAAPLFLVSACLAGAASFGIADGATAGTNREPRRDHKL